MQLNLSILPEPLAVCRMPAGSPVPDGLFEATFCAVTRTDDELSIVIPEAYIDATWRIEKGWRAIKVMGPLDFDIVGVVAALSKPLAEAGIPIFIISTFDTDYLLVKQERLDKAAGLLQKQGHSIPSFA